MAQSWAERKKNQRVRDRAAGLTRLEVRLTGQGQADLSAICNKLGISTPEAVELALRNEAGKPFYW